MAACWASSLCLHHHRWERSVSAFVRCRRGRHYPVPVQYRLHPWRWPSGPRLWSHGNRLDRSPGLSLDAARGTLAKASGKTRRVSQARVVWPLPGPESRCLQERRCELESLGRVVLVDDQVLQRLGRFPDRGVVRQGTLFTGLGRTSLSSGRNQESSRHLRLSATGRDRRASGHTRCNGHARSGCAGSQLRPGSAASFRPGR